MNNVTDLTEYRKNRGREVAQETPNLLDGVQLPASVPTIPGYIIPPEISYNDLTPVLRGKNWTLFNLYLDQMSFETVVVNEHTVEQLVDLIRKRLHALTEMER